MKKSAALVTSALFALVTLDASAGDTPPPPVVPSQPTPPASAPGAGLPPSMQSTPVPPTGTTALTSADADESVAPVPPPARPVDSSTTLYQKRGPNRPLLFTGAGIFLGSYATTAALTAADSTNRDKTMYVPIAGPWVHLADQDESTRDSVLIAGSGVLQGAGAALLIASFFVPEKVPAATIQGKNLTVHVTPTTFGPASAGFGAIGTF